MNKSKQHPMRLTKTIKNPHPDRRTSKTVWANTEWEEGGIWLLKEANGKTGASLELRGHHGRIDEDDERFDLLREAMEKLTLHDWADGHTQESADAFRAYMMMVNADPRTILANLYFEGKLTAQDLLGSCLNISELDEEAYECFYT